MPAVGEEEGEILLAVDEEEQEGVKSDSRREWLVDGNLAAN